MAEQAALHGRNAAAAVLAENFRELKKYIEKQNPSHRLLQQKLKKLSTAKEDLMMKHCYYGEKANKALDSNEMVEWLTSKLDDVNDAMDEAEVLLEDIEKTEELQQTEIQKVVDDKASEDKRTTGLKIAELQMKNDEQSVKDRIDAMMEVLNDDTRTTKEDGDLAEILLNEVEASLEEQIKSWNSYKAIPSDDEQKLQEIFLKETEIKNLVAERRILAHAFIKKVKPDVIVETQPSSTENRSADNAMMKVERMKLPTFSGDNRSYARFKKDFADIVAPSYPNEKQLIFTLKDTCLKGESKKLVENIVDIEDIWDRLDTKYGDTIEIVNLVIQDVQKFQLPRQDPEIGFINLVDTLERGLQDLSTIEARTEIANAYTVQLLEGKLPKRVLAKWLDKVCDQDDPSAISETVGTATTRTEINKKSRFEQLFEFLKQERKQTERMIQLREKKPPREEKKLPHHNVNAVQGNQQHRRNFNNRCIIHTNSSHLTRRCNVFLAMTAPERGKIVKDTGACKLCLSLSHPNAPCPFAEKWGPCNLQGCTEHHSRLVHGCGIQGISMHTYRYENLSATLLLIQSIRTVTDEVKAFWDNGSTLTLVAKSYAERQNLVGVSVTYELITVDKKVQVHHTVLHEIILLDRNGDKHTIKAYQIDTICKIPDVKIDGIVHTFPSVMQRDIVIESGEIELMIGMDYGDLHPKRVDSNNGLILYESQFGTGKVIAGTRREVQEENGFSEVVRHHAHAQLCRVRVSQNRGINPGVDFFSAEEFGVSIPPRCTKCKGCKDCRFETHQLSRIEQNELTEIRNNLQLDPINNTWSTSYPYKCDPNILENNRGQAIAFLERTEKRLYRNATTAKNYCDQFDDFIERGVLTEITEEEEKEYSGPAFYVTHHEVLKPESSSTPTRLVVNSSLKYKGISFNDVLMKGPNALRDLYGIQLNFRTHSHALVCDIKKMYHSVHTMVTEKHLRRMVWRDMKLDQPPKTYGFERVTFGDKPAAAITAVAIQETAKIYSHIDSEATKRIEEDVYADDMATGAESREEIKSLKKSIPEILSRGGFLIKGFVTSGDTAAESLSLLGSGEQGRVLGINWNPTTDELTVSTRINISEKYRGARTEPDLNYDDIPQILDVKLTRRIVLGIVNSCYDPIGLLCVITVQLKIELRKLYGKDLNLGWDDPLPLELKQRWVNLLQLLKKAEIVRFKRCIKPPTAVGDSDLIIFNDGSVDAMCVIAYVRWKLESGAYKCVLWTAKTRVTPLRKSTIPRIEMTSAVIGARLRKAIDGHCNMKFNRVIHILDSMCTLALLHKDTTALGEFMGNKVTEALEISQSNEFFHVCSKDNIADLGTRCDASIEDITEDSSYQCGPPWLKLESVEWPVSQDYTGTNVPEEELLKISAHVSVPTTHAIKLEDFKQDSYDFLLKVAAITIKIIQSKTFEIEALTPGDLENAEIHCLKMSMNRTMEDMKAGKLTSIRPVVDADGIVVLASRAKEGFKLHYNKDRFPILTYRDPLSFLWIKHVHEEDHSGITRTVAKSRRKYWIVKARRLAQKVRLSCLRCRLLDKKLALQQMAPLPKDRLSMTPVFYLTSMDLFGPIVIKDTVKQRCRKKVWGVIFTCDSSRAMYLDLTEDYGTDSILQTIRRFTSIRGCPSEFRSDQGSQLVSAAKDITALVEGWNWSDIHNWSTNQKIKWTVVPAEGQHQNGLSESLIKSVKRSIKHKIGQNVLTFSELQMTFFEIANIINSRPIGVLTGSDPDQPRPLTSNDLILGRSTSEVPQGPFDNCRSVNKRFRFLQNLVTEWWDCWYSTVLPSLVPSYKWLQRHRNVMVGDVCLIRYGKEKRATYRLGRVIEVVKGEDKLVRKVTLKYKLPNEKTFRTVDRPIHGIAVIVPVEEQEADEATESDDEVRGALDLAEEESNDDPEDVTSSVADVDCPSSPLQSSLNPNAKTYTPQIHTQQ